MQRNAAASERRVKLNINSADLQNGLNARSKRTAVSPKLNRHINDNDSFCALQDSPRFYIDVRDIDVTFALFKLVRFS